MKISQRVQEIWSGHESVTDRQMDRQTDESHPIIPRLKQPLSFPFHIPGCQKRLMKGEIYFLGMAKGMGRLWGRTSSFLLRCPPPPTLKWKAIMKTAVASLKSVSIHPIIK